MPVLTQVLLGFAGDETGIAGVRLQRERVADVAHDGERRHVETGIDENAVRVREQEHVALMDLLKAANARAVKADAVGEQRFGQLAHGDAEVLPAADQVGEAEIDHLHPAFLGAPDDLSWRWFAGDCRGHRGTRPLL